MSEKTKPTQLTAEEVQTMKDNMMKHYEDQIPFLTKQYEYESLLAEIEEARAKRIAMTIRIAEMTNQPPRPTMEGKSETKRSLKTTNND